MAIQQCGAFCNDSPIQSYDQYTNYNPRWLNEPCVFGATNKTYENCRAVCLEPAFSFQTEEQFHFCDWFSYNSEPISNSSEISLINKSYNFLCSPVSDPGVAYVMNTTYVDIINSNMFECMEQYCQNPLASLGGCPARNYTNIYNDYPTV